MSTCPVCGEERIPTCLCNWPECSSCAAKDAELDRLRAEVVDLTRQRDEALAMFEAAHERQKRAEADVADLRAHAEAMADDKTHYCRLVDLYECPCDEPGGCPVAAFRAWTAAHHLPPSGAGPDSMPGKEKP